MWYKYNIEHVHNEATTSNVIADIWKNVKPDPWYQKASDMRFKREVGRLMEKNYDELKSLMKKIQ